MLGMLVTLNRAVAHGMHQNLYVDVCTFMSVQDSSSALSECMWGQKTVLAVNPQTLSTLFITQGTLLI